MYGSASMELNIKPLSVLYGVYDMRDDSYHVEETKKVCHVY